jgi:4-amino-4-deoxy-L-arabinose transferase-like glycosyltransferase
MSMNRAQTFIIRRRMAGVIGALLIIFAVLYFAHMTTQVPSADPTGYLVAGQNLAAGRGLAFHDPNNAAVSPYFTLWTFAVQHPGDPDRYLNYPPGFPLLIALAIKVVPLAEAPFMVTPLLGLLGILATYKLGNLLLGARAGLFAAAFLGLSALYFRFSTNLWSDVPAAVFGTLAITCYVASMERERPSWLLASMSGVVLAYAVLIRYTSIVLCLPVALHVLTLQKPRRERLRVGAMVFAPFALLMCGVLLYNKSMYGGFLTTSYSPQQGWYPWPAFSLAYALGSSPVGGHSLVAVIRTLALDLPAALLLAIVGIGTMPPRAAIIIAGTILVTGGLYAFYAFPPEGINARFLAPALPMICLAAGAGLQFVLSRIRRPLPLGLFLASLPCIVSIALFISVIGRLDRETAELAGAVKQVETLVARTEPDAVLMSYNYNDLLSYYGHRSVLFYRRMLTADATTRRYKTEDYEPCLVMTIDRLLDRSTPVYYVAADATAGMFNLLTVLPKYYVLQPLGGDPQLYQVRRSAGSIRETAACQGPQVGTP